MKRILLAVAGLLLAAGTVTAAHASTTAPMPPGVQISHMAYQPGMHLPATRLPRLTPVNGTLTSQNWAGYADVACRTCAFRFVAASFILPSVNCAASSDGSVAGFWAGFEGLPATPSSRSAPLPAAPGAQRAMPPFTRCTRRSPSISPGSAQPG